MKQSPSNERISWGVDGFGVKVLFCDNCRETLYRTEKHYKIIQAQRVFEKKHRCETEESRK